MFSRFVQHQKFGIPLRITVKNGAILRTVQHPTSPPSGETRLLREVRTMNRFPHHQQQRAIT